MFIVDDMLNLILDYIADYTNRQYLSDLKDYLTRITLAYERGLLSREDYEERKGEVLRTIQTYSRLLEQNPSPRGSRELRL